jgi:hypothetical protein
MTATACVLGLSAQSGLLPLGFIPVGGYFAHTVRILLLTRFFPPTPRPQMFRFFILVHKVRPVRFLAASFH